MENYLIIRHGSNAANQPMQATKAIAIVLNARDRLVATQIVGERHMVYGNQRLEAIRESKLNKRQKEEWKDLLEREAAGDKKSVITWCS
jgi:hypothetical protein